MNHILQLSNILPSPLSPLKRVEAGVDVLSLALGSEQRSHTAAIYHVLFLLKKGASTDGFLLEAYQKLPTTVQTSVCI